MSEQSAAPIAGQNADALIVGGGLAGAATALHMARAGLKVTIFDRKRFPRDKPCGEGLMPHGVRMLDELGVLSLITQDDCRPFFGIEYIVDGTVRARGQFPELEAHPKLDGPHAPYKTGLGIRRLKLDEVILSMARAHPNVTVHEEVRVDGVLKEGERAVGLNTRAGEFYGRLVIGADGRGSMVRHQLGLDAPAAKRQRWGIRAHFSFADPARVGDYVEVYKNTYGEVYTTPVGPHELLVALLMEKADMERFGGKLERGYHDYLQNFPFLKERFHDAQPISPVIACGPLACASSQPFTDGAMLVGDAAGFLDAITGEGMTLALACARTAARVGVEALEQPGLVPARSLARYGSARKDIIRHYLIMTNALLYLSLHHRLAKFLIGRLSKAPGLFRMLLGLNMGQLRAKDIAWGDLGRFLVGI